MFWLIFLTAISGVVHTYYDPPVALQMAYLSAISYENPEVINKWSCKYCQLYQVKSPKSFANALTTIRGYTGYYEPLRSIIVAFKGADDVDYFISNLTNTKVEYNYCQGCEVSKIFAEQYSSVQATVLKQIQGLYSIYRGANIIVTGHGLGGSLALLAAAQTAKIYGVIYSVYTFGACRVGNLKFAEYYDQLVPATYRVIDYADVLPHLPPSVAGYQHSSSQKWYSQGMKSFTSCQGDQPSCSNSLPQSALNVADNNILNYLQLNVGISLEDLKK